MTSGLQTKNDKENRHCLKPDDSEPGATAVVTISYHHLRMMGFPDLQETDRQLPFLKQSLFLFRRNGLGVHILAGLHIPSEDQVSPLQDCANETNHSRQGRQKKKYKISKRDSNQVSFNSHIYKPVSNNLLHF